jgi:type II secretory ATPase GspE/PulE/Tfp pilus assembly ATPase PilB-like protein
MSNELSWPALPFYKLADERSDQPPRGPRNCSVEFTDGRTVRAELVEFEPAAGEVALRYADSERSQKVALKQIRSIRLMRPSSYVIDTEALQAVGAAGPQACQRKRFEIGLPDGGRMTGTTLGFVKESCGVFLFVVEGQVEPGLQDKPVRACHCFIPAAQVKELQIGPQLGDLLLGQHAVSADTLNLALGRQSKLRYEKIGKYLTDRAIISGQDLLIALQAQKKRPTVRIGDLLVEAELISRQQLQEALTIQANHRSRRLGEILIEMGAVSLRVIQYALSDKLGIPYVNVKEFKIGPGALEAIDMSVAIRRQVLPLLRTGETLIVAVEDPLAIDLTQEVRFHTGMGISPVIANPQELKARIAKEYANLDGRNEARTGFAATVPPDSRAANAAQTKVTDLTFQLERESSRSSRAARETTVDTRVSDNTLVKLVNKIIIEAHAQGASDIHIESNTGKLETRIRFRKDGDLEGYLDLPPAYSSALVSRLKIMADLDIAEHRKPQDGKIDFARHGPLPIELRVAIIPTVNNQEDVVLRILANAEALPLDAVGFSDSDLERLKHMISRNCGLVLVCGPTGSGKTTTLHSVLRELNKPDLKIWTAEDPVEITQQGLRQVQVQPKIDWTFAAAMRAFLRADPDIIMVGEMRDAETTKIGIEASLTGHLVLSTLHTNSAAESIIRLLEMGMDPFNFADALIGVLSQRLARKLCSNCRQVRVASPTELVDLAGEYCAGTKLDPEETLALWRRELGTDGHILLREPAGCDSCKDGYKGRVVVYELLSASPEIKHLVRTRGAVPELLSEALNGGMHSLRQCAIEKVLHGVLDLASARAVSS